MIPDSFDVFEWTAVDLRGRSRTYQTTGPSCETEAGIMDHLRQHYPHLRITSFKRIELRHIKRAVGSVQRHAFTNGIISQVERELGIYRADDFGKKLLTLAEKRESGNPRDALDYGVHIQREFDSAMTAARERAAVMARRSILGVGRSLKT